MTVISILALVLVQATTPAEAPSIESAALAYSGCVKTKAAAVSASMTPEQGADSVFAACKTQEDALRTRIEAQFAMLPADQQAEARKELANGLAEARNDIVDEIREARAKPEAPAAAN